MLGFVAGGLTAFVVLLLSVGLSVGDDSASTLLLVLLGLPCAIGLVTGGVLLLSRRRTRPLSLAAGGSVAALLVVLLTGIVTMDGSALLGLAMFVLLALPLPVLTGSTPGDRTSAPGRPTA